MADNTSIPIIVQGNSFSLAIPLQIYIISEGEMVLQDYTPDPTDEVSVQLKGSRRNYTYTPTIDGNVANIDLSGNELADNYGVVVSVVKANGQRLRSFRTDQFFIVESSDDLTVDDIIEGLEENVIYLNAQPFIAGADGRGIESIVKTSTSGLVDTYTITYTDATTSTFDVTNGANGAQGAQGVGITSIEKTGTSGLVDTYTITLSNGQTSTFEVTNGQDGHDLGLAVIVDDLTTGGHEDALSAEQGKKLGQAMSLVVDILKSSVYTVDKSTEIEELEEMFDNYVDVTKSLTNVSVSPDVSTAAKGTSLTLTFTPSSSHVIDTVTVTMGGVSQSVTIAQDQKSATCTIASVSDSIEITATAVYQETDLVDGVTPTSGYGILAQGNYGSNSNFSSILIPIQFGKRYKVTDYDWTGGTQTGYNVGLVKSNGSGGYTSLTSADLVSGSVFSKNNNLLTVASTYISKIWRTPVVEDFTFVTPKQTDLNGIDAIYLVINTRYSTLDIAGTFHVYEWKDADETFTAADEIKSLGLIFSNYNLGGNPSPNAFYNVAFVKAVKGATINYSGYNWSSLGATGDGYAIGLLKGDGQMFENLTANDLIGSAWLSNDTFFLHSDNLYKKRCDASGSFTIPSNTDYAGDIYIAINTAFGTSSSYEDRDVKNTFTLTQE